MTCRIDLRATFNRWGRWGGVIIFHTFLMLRSGFFLALFNTLLLLHFGSSLALFNTLFFADDVHGIHFFDDFDVMPWNDFQLNMSSS